MKEEKEWVKCTCQKFYHPPKRSACDLCLLRHGGLHGGRSDSSDREGLGPRLYEEAPVLEALDISHRLAAACATYRAALELILPLAKGYAADHPVGSNAEYVKEAEAALARVRGGMDAAT